METDKAKDLQHEIRNAVWGIMGMLTVINKRIDQSPDSKLAVINIEKACERILKAMDCYWNEYKAMQRQKDADKDS